MIQDLRGLELHIRLIEDRMVGMYLRLEDQGR